MTDRLSPEFRAIRVMENLVSSDDAAAKRVIAWAESKLAAKEINSFKEILHELALTVDEARTLEAKMVEEEKRS